MKIKIKDLVFDDEIYPRSHVDIQTVNRFRNALSCGEVFPPIIIDKKTKRIIDGWHRATAYKIVFSDDTEVECELKEYKSELDLLVDAIRRNTRHGLPLTSYDKALCVTRLHKLGLNDELTRQHLLLTEKNYTSLVKRKLAFRNGDVVPIKRTFAHLAGTEIKEQTLDVNKRAGGHAPLFYVNQLIDLLVHDLIDLDNEHLCESLVKLSKLIEEKISCTV